MQCDDTGIKQSGKVSGAVRMPTMKRARTLDPAPPLTSAESNDEGAMVTADLGDAAPPNRKGG